MTGGKPPPGFMPVPGGLKGGYRKPKPGGGWDYWYPSGSGMLNSGDKLPEELDRFFLRTPTARDLPVSALRATRARPTGIANAAVYMRRAYNGTMDKRAPINVRDNGDGTYDVLDGNSTFAVAVENGWQKIRVEVEPADAQKGGPFADLLAWVGDRIEKAATGRPPGAGWLPTPGSRKGTWRRRKGEGWEYHPGTSKAPDPATTHKVEEQARAAAYEYLEAHRGQGNLADKTARQHVMLYHELAAKHSASLPDFHAQLNLAAPAGADIKTRIKAFTSTMVKLASRHRERGGWTNFADAGRLLDMTGAQVVLDSLEDVRTFVQKARDVFSVSFIDDYIANPLGGSYRSIHIYTKDSNGLRKEIQVRTRNQHLYAEWAHQLYKPRTEEQSAALANPTIRAAADAYSRLLSDTLARRDRGEAAPLPEPPDGLLEVFPHWIPEDPNAPIVED